MHACVFTHSSDTLVILGLDLVLEYLGIIRVTGPLRVLLHEQHCGVRALAGTNVEYHLPDVS